MDAIDMETNELSRERQTAEVWALHLVDGAVVGCCDPPAGRDREPRVPDSVEQTRERGEWVDGHLHAVDLTEPPAVVR